MRAVRTETGAPVAAFLDGELRGLADRADPQCQGAVAEDLHCRVRIDAGREKLPA